MRCHYQRTLDGAPVFLPPGEDTVPCLLPVGVQLVYADGAALLKTPVCDDHYALRRAFAALKRAGGVE